MSQLYSSILHIEEYDLLFYESKDKQNIIAYIYVSNDDINFRFSDLFSSYVTELARITNHGIYLQYYFTQIVMTYIRVKFERPLQVHLSSKYWVLWPYWFLYKIIQFLKYANFQSKHYSLKRYFYEYATRNLRKLIVTIFRTSNMLTLTVWSSQFDR
jgi:hypothetical protein